eukprot:SAG11_NODE_139_length_15111_cov_9.482214_9_plen_89_part_01
MNDADRKGIALSREAPGKRGSTQLCPRNQCAITQDGERTCWPHVVIHGNFFQSQTPRFFLFPPESDPPPPPPPPPLFFILFFLFFYTMV